MEDLLNWIARNGGVAFVLGIFLIILLGFCVRLLNDFFDFLVRLARAFTGKYPPPDTVVQCPCHDEDEEDEGGENGTGS